MNMTLNYERIEHRLLSLTYKVLTTSHGSEIWDKMGRNLTCMGNITEMFAPSIGGFGGWVIERRRTNSTTADSCCHGNQF